MQNYLILLSIVFFTFQCVPNTNKDENLDNEDIKKPEELEGINKLEALEKKMEELENDKKTYVLIKNVVKQKAKGAKYVQVDINIGVCKLKLSSGSNQLFTGGFAYSQKSWKPEINYSVAKQIGYLTINQPETNNINIDGNDQYVWNLKFGKDTPFDINLELGAGVAEIALSELPIKNFNMVMGVGKTVLDLRGKWKQNTEIHLDGGIGLLKVYLPKNVGVKVYALKGLGNIKVQKLTKKSKNTYVNEWFSKSEITIKIYLKTGIGKIEIE